MLVNSGAPTSAQVYGWIPVDVSELYSSSSIFEPLRDVDNRVTWIPSACRHVKGKGRRHAPWPNCTSCYLCILIFFVIRLCFLHHAINVAKCYKTCLCVSFIEIYCSVKCAFIYCKTGYFSGHFIFAVIIQSAKIKIYG